MQITSTPPATLPTIPEQLDSFAARLDASVPGINTGVQTLRTANMAGSDWLEQFNAASKRSSEQWAESLATVRAVHAGVATLEPSAMSAAARAAMDGAMTLINRNLDNVGRGYMGFWRSPSQQGASMTLASVATAMERIAREVATAAQSLRDIARAPVTGPQANRGAA